MKRLLFIIWSIFIVVATVRAGEWTRTPFSCGNVEVPKATFHSTSAMHGINSTYTPSPRLGEDGMATYNPKDASQPSSHIRKAGGVEPTDDDEELPIGDALLPLLLMALAYSCVRMRRRQKACPPV